MPYGTVLVTLALASAASQVVQDKGFIGDFTRSPTEHFIVERPAPFVVRSVRGSIHIKGSGQGDPLPNALFEIQGPGKDKRLRHATTDEHGRFKISHVRRGTYKFKATLGGFQSVMGTIIVPKEAGDDEIRIEMPVGV